MGEDTIFNVGLKVGLGPHDPGGVACTEMEPPGGTRVQCGSGDVGHAWLCGVGRVGNEASWSRWSRRLPV